MCLDEEAVDRFAPTGFDKITISDEDIVKHICTNKHIFINETFL